MPRLSPCAESQPTDRYANGCSDRGSASLEFITAGLLMLVPLVYLILTLGAIQSAALATEGAARQAARVFVQAESNAAGAAAAERALELALDDHGIDAQGTSLAISCRPRSGECLTRRGWVTIDIAVRVPLPLVPPVFDLRVPLAIPVEASATQQVSRFWGAR